MSRHQARLTTLLSHAIASLRIQTNPENRKDFAKMSDERYALLPAPKNPGRHSPPFLPMVSLPPCNCAGADRASVLLKYRAFADYVLSSLLLHFFCVNFIN